MPKSLDSQRLLRGFTWLSALTLIAGVLAFATVKLSGGDGGEDARPAANAPPAVKPPATKKLTAKDVPRAVRVVAGEFILAAAGREDLKKAWRISHPDLKAQCDCTYKEWLTGNIPVQYYPVGNLDVATFAVDEVTRNYVVLQVALIPKDGSDVKPQTFFIGVRAAKQGDKRRWLVDYWAPYVTIPVPSEVQ